MNICNNHDLTEGVDLFPNDLDGPVAIVLFADTDSGTLHFHQGSDCIVLPHHLADDFADAVEAAAGIEYARADPE